MGFAQMMKLDKDLQTAIGKMGRGAVRALVYLYYLFQEDRKRTANQLRALKEKNEESAVIEWFVKCANTREKITKDTLERYAETQRIGRWTMSLFGFGPVIAAGLPAHIDLTRAPTVGHIHRFGGVCPDQVWHRRDVTSKMVTSAYEEAKAKRDEADADVNTIAARILAGKTGRRVSNFMRDVDRLSYKKGTEPKRDENGKIIITPKGVRSAAGLCPWNSDLKTLIWKIGDCINKFHKNEKSFYGPHYVEHWESLKKKNESGGYKERAARILAGEEQKSPGKGTEAYKHLLEGRLPPGHILAMAKRWAAKLFLSHWHFRARTYEGLPAPRPYALDIMGHTHYIEPPPDVP